MTPEIPNECECCPTTRDSLLSLAKVMRVSDPNYDGDLKNYHGMWMCPKCYLKEIQLSKESKANSEQRVSESRAREDASVLINKAKEIDASLQITTDLFNAKTVAIMELKLAIDSDAAIDNKQFALAELIANRINHFQRVISGLRKDLVEANNDLRAHQEYFNNLANTLRQEEREKLKLQDINYTPGGPKIKRPPKDGKVIRVTKKWDVKKIKELAAQYNVPMEMIQGTIIARKMTPDDAAKFCANLLHPGSN